MKPIKELTIKNLGDLPLGYLYDITWLETTVDTWHLLDRSIWDPVNDSARESVSYIVRDSVRTKYSQS